MLSLNDGSMIPYGRRDNNYLYISPEGNLLPAYGTTPNTTAIAATGSGVMATTPAQVPVVQVINNPSMPSATQMTMPSVVGTSTTVLPPASRSFGLTPRNLLNPLPSIVNTQPAVMPQSCGGVGGWVGDNPLLAALGLVALFFAVKK